MDLFSTLHDDVVWAQFHVSDAFNFSLTCKHARSLAFKRASSTVVCNSPFQLQRLAEYMLDTEPGDNVPGATYLESLTIQLETFYAPLSGGSSYTEDLMPYGDDFTHAGLITDILSEALNLREFSLECFQSCIDECPAVAAALFRLRRLTHLELEAVVDLSLSTVQQIPSDLTSLTLYFADPSVLSGHSLTLQGISFTLAAFRSLRTIELWDFVPRSDLDAAPLSFPSVRHLRLSRSSIPALHLVQLCPNLTTLIFSLIHANAHTTPSVGPRWSHMKCLQVWDENELALVVERLSSVDSLQIRPLNLCLSHYAEQESASLPIMAALRATNPLSLYHGLSCGLEPISFTSTFLWRHIASVAPRIRSLELEILRNDEQIGYEDTLQAVEYWTALPVCLSTMLYYPNSLTSVIFRLLSRLLSPRFPSFHSSFSYIRSTRIRYVARIV